jgi:hypothetical protein
MMYSASMRKLYAGFHNSIPGNAAQSGYFVFDEPTSGSPVRKPILSKAWWCVFHIATRLYTLFVFFCSRKNKVTKEGLWSFPSLTQVV